MRAVAAFRGIAGCIAGLVFLSLFHPISLCGQAIPFAVGFWYPTNGEVFGATADIGVHARVSDSNVVTTVQYFANAAAIGMVTNTSHVLVTNLSQANPFDYSWSNVVAGGYSITAVVKDTAGDMATSAPVNITVTNPIVEPAVYIYSPTNNAKLPGPTNLTLYARAVESGGTVATVTFFANNTSLGVVSNNCQAVFSSISSEPLFPLTWTNAQPGNYALKAVATDLYGNSATSSVVNIVVLTNTSPPPVPFLVSFWYPTNGETFVAPTNIGVHALVTDSNVVETVQYFANGAGIGTVTNTTSMLLTNMSQDSPFYMDWSNMPAGSYALTALATDKAGRMATSAPVNITVTGPTNSPPPVPFLVSFWYPTNGETFTAPANIAVHALVTDSNVVKTVQYFANGAGIVTITNTSGVLLTNSTEGNPFEYTWSNVAAGSYALIAVAKDSAGNTATSAPVSITVSAPTNVPPPAPFTVSFWYPTNGEIYVAPANIGVHAKVTDSNVVETVQYFANGTGIGIVTNTSGELLTNSTEGNPFFLDWSNVAAGSYALTALATDSAGNTAISAPVNIYVVTNAPTVTIYATDPVAIVGTNYPSIYAPTSSETNYISGTNTATFLVRRDSQTNSALTVYYSIGGTASNGVDYAALPGLVNLSAGQHYALIPVIPLNETNATGRYKTVVLTLAEPTNPPPTYLIGSPSSAGAVIVEGNYLPMLQPMIHNMPDSSLHVSLPATNGVNYCLEISTDMVNWTAVCTNTVLKGSAHFVDPKGAAGPCRFYRIVQVPAPASY